MKVSVIIPAYNCAQFIDSTINSVEQQTYPKDLIDVIIVNDGSTDKTPELLEAYRDRYLIINTENRGVSHARNTGLAHAQGNYIQFLDSDDLLAPNKIEKQVQALIESDGDVAYGNWAKFQENDGEIAVKEKIEREIDGDKELALFTDFWCPPAALLYSRRIVEKIGPWKEWLPVIQDARYFLDAALNKGKFVHTPFIAAHYREHQFGSLSTRSKKAFTEDVFLNLKDVYDLWYAENKLTDRHVETVKDGLSSCINIFSQCNSAFFIPAIDYLLSIDPKYLPRERGLLRFLTLVVGYKNAEQIAAIKRRLWG